MKWNEGPWPTDLDENSGKYPKWMIRLANVERKNLRFWLSPAGALTLVAIFIVSYLLHLAQKY
ncbi:hypothetical protein H3C66_03570 [Patescibacteria group bacterium]|nr:hypothetical protein [Patescibacteria group bacterium]